MSSREDELLQMLESRKQRYSTMSAGRNAITHDASSGLLALSSIAVTVCSFFRFCCSFFFLVLATLATRITSPFFRYFFLVVE
jgi:hypothetical protein